MELETLPWELSICKLSDITDADLRMEFFFSGRTDEELSLVCRTEDVPPGALVHDDGWKAFRVRGILDFSLTGILAKLSGILAENEIGIFAVSTYNTDYILVKAENFDRAMQALENKGYIIRQNGGKAMNEALQNLLTRRSCRSYKAEQIRPEELDAILEAEQYAPTGMGKQTPIIVVVQDAEKIREIEKLNGAVMGNPDAHPFYGAPTLIVVFGDSESPLGTADANLVIGNLLNGANAVGVDSCYIWRARESFDSEGGKALKAAWNIPDNYVGIGNVILGYGKPEGKREAAPRKADYVRRV